MPRERYMRTSEVALKLQVSPKTVARWAKEGRLPYLATLGGHRRFPATAIDKIADSLSSLDALVHYTQQAAATAAAPRTGAP